MNYAANLATRLRSALLGACLAIASTSLTSCQSLGPDSGTDQLSKDAVVLAVPLLFQDELYECGLATVSALCQYHNREIAADDRARLVKIAEQEDGLSGAELRDVLEAQGLEVYIFRGTLDDDLSGLYYHIDRKRPVLVMISDDGDSHHYCLVTGYDESTNSIVVLDPRRGQLVFATAGFESVWARSGYFSLLCSPPDEIS